MPEVLITVGIVVAALLIILIAIFSTWKKVPADKAAIVTGLGRAKVITGGGGCQEYFKIIKENESINICSALYSPLMVRQAVDMAISVLKGETVDPVLVIPTTIVDRSNVDEYLDPNNTVY